MFTNDFDYFHPDIQLFFIELNFRKFYYETGLFLLQISIIFIRNFIRHVIRLLKCPQESRLLTSLIEKGEVKTMGFAHGLDFVTQWNNYSIWLREGCLVPTARKSLGIKKAIPHKQWFIEWTLWTRLFMALNNDPFRELRISLCNFNNDASLKEKFIRHMITYCFPPNKF